MSGTFGSERDTIRQRLIERIVLVLVAGIIGLSLLKTMVPSVAFPGWDLDPSLLAGPVVGLGPTANLGIDVLLVALSGCVLALASVAGAAVRWWRWFLLYVGLAAVVWHARLGPAAAQDHLTLGGSWSAAMSACVAISAAARFATVARLAAALLLGSIAFFALKAGVQVYIENPQTIEMFKANREAMLAAQGWTADSFAAKAFERRLYDAPGTGWLGLSNVLATAGACAAVAAVMFSVRSETRRLGVIAAAFAGVAVLFFAGSKGGWGSAALGVAALAIWPWVSKRRFGVTTLLVAMPLIALCAIAMRGLLGERLGELSILFRAQYLAAAARVFAEHPLVGVGPAGFKDAYMLAKSPLNPEEISSPHSVFFDLAAALGCAGIAWAGLLVSMIVSAGRVADSGPADEVGADPALPRVLLLTLSLVTIAGAWVELEISSPPNVLVRIGGLVVASIIGLGVVAVPSLNAIRLAAAIAAAVGLTHGMIEMTPVFSGSAALFACMIGLAGATRPASVATPARWSTVRAAPGLALAALAVAALTSVAGIARWESLLRSAAEAMGRSAMLSRSFSDAMDTDSRVRALQDLSEAVGTSVEPTQDGVARALQQVRVAGAEAALQDLVAAIVAAPSHSETREVASRAALQLAALRPPNSPERRDLRQRAIQLAADSTNLALRKAATRAWLANVLRGAADLGGDPTLRRDALVALEQAALFDPWNPIHAANAAKLADDLRDVPAARRWASKALELDENMRLDPLRRFEASERARLEAIASRQ